MFLFASSPEWRAREWRGWGWRWHVKPRVSIGQTLGLIWFGGFRSSHWSPSLGMASKIYCCNKGLLICDKMSGVDSRTIDFKRILGIWRFENGFFSCIFQTVQSQLNKTLPHFLRFSRTIARVTLLQLHFDCGDPPRYQCLKPYNFNISFNCQPKNGDSPVNKATGSLCQSCFIHSLQCISQTQWNLRQGVYQFSKELLVAIASYHTHIYIYICI